MRASRHAVAILCTFAVATLTGAASAADLPASGAQLQQIAPPPSPPKPQAVLPAEHKPVAAPRKADERRIRVRNIEITGATVLPVAELLSEARFVPESQLSLTELREITARIADHYRNKGYFLAQAFLPPQDISDGLISITVVEGRYGQVQLRNQSNLQDSVARDLLEPLKPDTVISTQTMERAVLMLSDQPGVAVRSTLVPGQATGTSDVVVDISSTGRTSGSVEVDNQGNRYTGTNRLGLVAGVSQLLGLGDAATARLVTSAGDMDYGSLHYQWQAGPVRAALGYTAMRYRLGEEFASAMAGGTARIVNMSATYPWVRSRQRNLNVQLALDDKHFSDRSDAVATASLTEKRSHVAGLAVHGDWRDDWGAGALTSYTLTLSGGSLDISSADARAADALTARTRGDFAKANFNLTRQQSLTPESGLYVSLTGQSASTNLDASEKFSLGGAQGVRAYPSGEGNGDEGFLLTLESRTLLGGLSQLLSGRAQLVLFWDTGVVSANKKPWSSVGLTADRRLSGAGVGLNWTGPGAASPVIRVFYAHKLGNEAAISAPDASSRLWLQAVYYF